MCELTNGMLWARHAMCELTNGMAWTWHAMCELTNGMAWARHAMCESALIYTCHAAPLPCSDSAMSFVKVSVVAGNIRTASPTI